MKMRRLLFALLIIALGSAQALAQTAPPTPRPPAPPAAAKAAAAFFKAVNDGRGAAAWEMLTKHTQDEMVAAAAANYRTTGLAIRAGLTGKPGFLNSLFDDIRTMIATGPWKGTIETGAWTGTWDGQASAELSCPAWAAQESGPLELRYEGGAWRVGWSETLYPADPL